MFSPTQQQKAAVPGPRLLLLRALLLTLCFWISGCAQGKPIKQPVEKPELSAHEQRGEHAGNEPGSAAENHNSCNEAQVERLLQIFGNRGIDAAYEGLQWLRERQEKDGRWDWNSHNSDKKDEFSAASDSEGMYDVALTGAILFCLTSYGHTYKDGEYPEFVESLRKGMRWLFEQQVQDSQSPDCGLIASKHIRKMDLSSLPESRRNSACLGHAIATLALLEINWLVGGDDKYKKQLELAANKCVQLAAADKILDMKACCWLLLAVRMCKAHEAQKMVTLDKLQLDSAYSNLLTKIENSSDEVALDFSVGRALLQGEKRSSEKLIAEHSKLVDSLPSWIEALESQKSKFKSELDLTLLYFSSLSVYFFGGEDWKDWTALINEAIVAARETDRPEELEEKESEDNFANYNHYTSWWSPTGKDGPERCRLYSSALAVLRTTLYYKYSR